MDENKQSLVSYFKGTTRNKKHSASTINRYLKIVLGALKSYYDSISEHKRESIAKELNKCFSPIICDFFIENKVIKTNKEGNYLNGSDISRFKNEKSLYDTLNHLTADLYCVYFGFAGKVGFKDKVSLYDFFQIKEDEHLFDKKEFIKYLHFNNLDFEKSALENNEVSGKGILEDLIKAMKSMVSDERGKKKSKRLPYWLRFSSVIIILIATIFFVIKPFLNKDESIEKNRWEVNVVPKEHNPKTVFSKDSSSFKLLILPFEDNETDELSRLEKKFLRRFEEIKHQDSLNIEVKYINDRAIAPFHPNQAEILVKEYNADMALWGDFIQNEKLKDDQISIKHSLSKNIFKKMEEINPKIKRTDIYNGKIKSKIYIRNGEFQEKIDNIIFWIVTMKYAISKENEKALKAIKLINISNIDSSKELCNLGWFYSQIGNYNKAISIYKKAAIIEPKFAEIWFNLGVNFNNLKENLNAIDMYDKAIEIDSQYVEAWFNKGVSLNNLGEKKIANETYDTVLQINPDFEKALLNKGTILSHLGDKEKALELFIKAISIKPDFAEAWSSIGNVQSSLGENEIALEAYRTAVLIKHEFADAWFNMGILFTRLDRIDEAISAYYTVIEISPMSSKAWYNLGVLFMSLEKHKEAQSLFTTTTLINPQNSDAWFNLGDIQLFFKNDNKALENYKKSLNLWNCSEEFFKHYDDNFQYIQLQNISKNHYQSIKLKLRNYCNNR